MLMTRNYARHFVQSSMFVFMLQIAGVFIGYLLRLTLTRTMTVEEYGLLYAVMAFTGIFILFRDLGLKSCFAGFQRIRTYALADTMRLGLVFAFLLLLPGIIGVAYSFLFATIITSFTMFIIFLKI